MVSHSPIILYPDGTTAQLNYVRPQDEANSRELQDSLTVLQGAVGGYFEVVAVPDNESLVLIVNEDGRQLGLKPNAPASELARQAIVGVAVLIPKVLLC
jgi:uncharacterized protein DUF3846